MGHDEPHLERFIYLGPGRDGREAPRAEQARRVFAVVRRALGIEGVRTREDLQRALARRKGSVQALREQAKPLRAALVQADAYRAQRNPKHDRVCDGITAALHGVEVELLRVLARPSGGHPGQPRKGPEADAYRWLLEWVDGKSQDERVYEMVSALYPDLDPSWVTKEAERICRALAPDRTR